MSFLILSSKTDSEKKIGRGSTMKVKSNNIVNANEGYVIAPKTIVLFLYSFYRGKTKKI